MSREWRGTGEQDSVSFPCLSSSPATVRARHFMPAVFRPLDGGREKSGAERRLSPFRKERRPRAAALVTSAPCRRSGPAKVKARCRPDGIEGACMAFFGSGSGLHRAVEPRVCEQRGAAWKTENILR